MAFSYIIYWTFLGNGLMM